MSKVICFDAAASGHHGEFLENLIYGVYPDVCHDITVLAHPGLYQRLEIARAKANFPHHICYLETAELNYMDAAKGIVQIGKRQLEVLAKYLQKFEGDHVILMHMNLHQYALRDKP